MAEGEYPIFIQCYFTEIEILKRPKFFVGLNYSSALSDEIFHR